MANWLIETIRPRIRAGEISAMYIGEVIEAAPIAKPPRMRKTTNIVTLCGSAVPTAETRKNNAGQDQHLLPPQPVAQEAGHRRPCRAAQKHARRGPARLQRRVEVEMRCADSRSPRR